MRRLFQFRLRTLFLLTTLAAVMCAVGIPAVERYREHQRRLATERYYTLILSKLNSGGPARQQRIVHADRPMLLLTELPSAAEIATELDPLSPVLPVDTD